MRHAAFAVTILAWWHLQSLCHNSDTILTELSPCLEIHFDWYTSGSQPQISVTCPALCSASLEWHALHHWPSCWLGIFAYAGTVLSGVNETLSEAWITHSARLCLAKHLISCGSHLHRQHRAALMKCLVHGIQKTVIGYASYNAWVRSGSRGPGTSLATHKVFCSSAQMQKAQNSGYTAFVARTNKEVTTCGISGSEDNV